MNYDLQSAPTDDEIAADRARLAHLIAKDGRQRRWLFVVAVALAALAIPWVQMSEPNTSIGLALSFVAAVGLGVLAGSFLPGSYWIFIMVFGALGAVQCRGSGWEAAIVGFVAAGTFRAIREDCREQRIGALNSELLGLEPVKPDVCPKVLSLCQKYDELADYQGRVSDMGRQLTSGEADYMQQWATSERIRLEKQEWEARTREACHTLLSPVRRSGAPENGAAT